MTRTEKAKNDFEQKVSESKYEFGNKYQYIHTKEKVQLICPEHGEFWIAPNHFKKGKGCIKCAGTCPKQAKIGFEKQVSVSKYEFGSEYKYIGAIEKVQLICSEHGEFWIKPSSFKSGHGCIKCAGNCPEQAQSGLEQKISESKYKFGNKYEYINDSTKVQLICPEHGEFWIKPNDLKNGHGCAGCAGSNNENSCRDIIQELTGYNFPKRNPAFLKNPKTGRNLELDGYCEELKLAFEYDGEQHFKAVEYWGGEEALKKTQKYDRLKNKLCKKEGINLIRIPYTVKNKEQYIKRQLKNILIFSTI